MSKKVISGYCPFKDELFRNIEDIYDKDILRLQNFQNLVAGDINKIKLDLTGTFQIL
jgi:hypothetical protein